MGGDSGGPLFDLEGRVIGVNSLVTGSMQGNVHVHIDVYHKNWKKLNDGEDWAAKGNTKGKQSQTALPLPELDSTLLKQRGGKRQPELERNHDVIREAFREAVEPASKSTVRILIDGKPAMLGTVVAADGLIVTKASALSGGGKVTLSLASLWSGVRHTLSTWTGQVAVAGGGVAAATVVVLAVAPHITSLQAPEDTLVTPRPNAAATAPPPGAPGSPTPGGGRATGGAAPAVPGATPGGTAESGGPSSSQGPDGSTASAPWSASPDVIDRNNPGRAAVTLSLSPAGSLTRGTASTLVLSLTNDGRTAGETPGEGPATARVTAELALPRGVTLRAPGAGDHWQCAAISSGAVCHRPSLPAGWTTTARIPVTVAPDAESGVPWATVTSTNIGSRTVESTSGVTGTADDRSDVAPSRTADQDGHDSQDGRAEDD